MAFTVEDGTIVTDANSLCSVEYADAYFEDRGIVTWTGSDAEKERALVRATDYLEIRYGLQWRGSKADDAQSLSFPRTSIDQDDIVPIAVRKACSEYALRALTAELAPDPEANEFGRVGLISESHKVGPIEDTYRYASRGTGTAPPPFRPYPAADNLLNGLLKYQGGVVR